MATTLVARQLGSHRRGAPRVQRPAPETMRSTETMSTARPPHPTTAARFGLRHQENLGSETCGFPVENDSVPSFTCGVGDTCAQSPEEHAIGCCPSGQLDSCVLQTACIEWGLVKNHRDLGKTLSCRPGFNAYCATYTYSMDGKEYDGYSAFGCAAENTVITVRAFPATDDSTATSKGPIITNSVPTSSRGLSSSLGSSSASEPLTYSSGLPNVGVTDPVGNNPQLPTGKIAGSVVGGVAGFALLAAGIVLFVLRSRKRNKKEEEQMEKPAATAPSPTSGGHGEGKDLFPLMAAPPVKDAAQPTTEQHTGHSSSLVSPNPYHNRSSGVPGDHPVNPMPEEEPIAHREGRKVLANETGGRVYSIQNRPPSSHYHAYNPVSGGPVELPATTVHEME